MRAFGIKYTLIARKIRAGDSGGQYYHSYERRFESSSQPDTRRHRHEFQHLRNHGKHPARKSATPAFDTSVRAAEPNEQTKRAMLEAEAKERGILPDDAATFNSAQDAITWLHNNHG